METQGTDLNLRYTALSDRFRSLWTFYQFLGGVFKHQDRGAPPFEYDFQGLYRRVQGLLPRVGVGTFVEPATITEFEQIEKELSTIHRRLSEIERQFSPSLLRRFFDHLKNQDEKILFALVKFYILDPDPARDTYDKLDILLTRLAGEQTESGRDRMRDRRELTTSFGRLAEIGNIPAPTAGEERTLKGLIHEIRSDLDAFEDFPSLLEARLIDRYRELKERLGRAGLYPSLLVEIVETNLALKNRFLDLYMEEEARILEDTNKVFEIERYIERNPEVADEEMRQKLDFFRASRERFDASRRDNNVKRHDIAALREAMNSVLDSFEPRRGAFAPAADAGPAIRQPETPPAATGGPTTEVTTVSAPPSQAPESPAPAATGAPTTEVTNVSALPSPAPKTPPPPTPVADPAPGPAPDAAEASPSAEAPPEEEAGGLGGDAAETAIEEPVEGPFGPPADMAEDVDEMEDLEPVQGDEIGLADLLPQDPLLAPALHKIIFALELVSWEHGVEHVTGAREIHHLKLEPWEAATYRKLMSLKGAVGTRAWELQAFFLIAAALRVKMEEELGEVARLRDAGPPERLLQMLENSSQSLERAREIDRRFRWFIDDMLFQGDTVLLEQVYRSHFRFLKVFSSLWLEHQSSGGVAPM